MSVKQIDDALSSWKVRLAAAAQNLLDVQSHPVFQRISAPEADLEGETAQKSAIAARTLSYLLQCFDLLQAAITRAEDLRSDMPALFGAEEREREIANVLRGKSIHLPSVQVSLQHRTLLTSIENVDAISPPELLNFMESAFENVKQIVLSLDAAWESLGTVIERATHQVAALRGKSDRLSTTDRVDLENTAQQLKSLEALATHDPLGPAAAIAKSVDDALVRISAKLEQIERERKQAADALTSARDLLSKLKGEHESTRAVYLEAKDKADCTLDFAACEEKWNGLAAWFDRLSSAPSGTAPASILVAVRNWTYAAQQALAGDRALSAEARQVLAARSELRGRLDALKAKARAYSLAENDELMTLANEATALLYTRPTPMEQAASLVSAYEAKLNSRAGKHV